MEALAYMYHDYLFNELKLERGKLFIKANQYDGPFPYDEISEDIEIDNETKFMIEFGLMQSDDFNVDTVSNDRSIDMVDYITIIGAVALHEHEEFLEDFSFGEDEQFEKFLEECKTKITEKDNVYEIADDIREAVYSFGYSIIVNCLTEGCIDLKKVVKINNYSHVINEDRIEYINLILVGTSRKNMNMSEFKNSPCIDQNGVIIIVEKEDTIPDGYKKIMDMDDKEWNDHKFKISLFIMKNHDKF